MREADAALDRKMSLRGALPVAVLAALAAACGAGRPPAPDAVVVSSPPVAPPSTPPPPTPAPSTDLPPALVVRLSPPRIEGEAPLQLDVDLCESRDPEGRGLTYAFEFHGEGKRLGADCRARHVYGQPVQAEAWFCVTDGHVEHLICRRFDVRVQP
jgi:hypothetical protein